MLKGRFPANCILKSDQWVMLNRRHVRLLLSLPGEFGKQTLLEQFNKVN